MRDAKLSRLSTGIEGKQKGPASLPALPPRPTFSGAGQLPMTNPQQPIPVLCCLPRPLRQNGILNPSQRNQEQRRQEHAEQHVDPDEGRVECPEPEACEK